MAHPYHHSLSSVKKWGGAVDDCLPIHNWFDASKQITADFRHRALRHALKRALRRDLMLSRPVRHGRLSMARVARAGERRLTVT